MHRQLIGAGAALAILGVLLLVLALGNRSARSEETRVSGAPPAAVESRRGPMVLTVAAGLCLAAGAGLVGIGANRWYAYRERTTGDRTVRR
jgi:hypothetical protein